MTSAFASTTVCLRCGLVAPVGSRCIRYHSYGIVLSSPQLAQGTKLASLAIRSNSQRIYDGLVLLGLGAWSVECDGPSQLLPSCFYFALGHSMPPGLSIATPGGGYSQNSPHNLNPLSGAMQLLIHTPSQRGVLPIVRPVSHLPVVWREVSYRHRTTPAQLSPQ